MTKAFYLMMGFIAFLSLCLGLMLTVDKTEIVTLNDFTIDGHLQLNADKIYVKNAVINGGLVIDGTGYCDSTMTIFITFDREIEAVEPDDDSTNSGSIFDEPDQSLQWYDVPDHSDSEELCPEDFFLDDTQRVYRRIGDRFYIAQ